MNYPDNQLLVIFGASGDLTRRKLIPALFALHCQKSLPERFAILGVGRTAMTSGSFRENQKKWLLQSNGTNQPQNELDSFLSLLHYLSIETSVPEEYEKVLNRANELNDTLNLDHNYVFYLSTPPDLYEMIAGSLAQYNLTRHPTGWRRIIVEKPFGRDLLSARELNRKLLASFGEEQIYRIDHYLGKETVQNVMVTRFSNGIFEPLWNRNYIHHVEITSAESLGVEARGCYYDGSGALRDMVQNHLFQLTSLVAMEPPTRIDSDAIRNETLKVLQSIRPFHSDTIESSIIRGQYTESFIRGNLTNSYRSEQGVHKESRTETYVAMKLFIDNWRWGGVPFYIRTGKRLPTRVTEIVVHFRATPHALFSFNRGISNSENQLVMRIQPDEGILLKFGMKLPGVGYQVQDVNMDFHYADLADHPIPEAYQRLLLDCMQGDATLFTRGDAIEQSWTIIDPVLKAWENESSIPIFGYPSGTWGPQQADSLIEGHHATWRYPCKNLSDDGIYCEL